MLILTRRNGESLMVGDEVKITVLSIKGNQVRIGIDAPKEIAVHREEIYERIRDEQAALAAQEENSKPQSANSLEKCNVEPITT